MEVGAVDYQLCPLNLNCDKCDFYSEMAQGCHHAIAQKTTPSYITFQKPRPEGITFKPGYQYLHGHFWFKHIARNRVLVGIDDILWKMFCPPKAIILSDPGTQILKENCFAWVIIPHGIVYLKMPLSGRVLNHNPLITENNNQLSELKYVDAEAKWFLALEVDEKELQTFESLTKQEYIDRVKADCERIYQTVSGMYADGSAPTSDQHPYPEPEAERLVLGEKGDFTALLKKTTANHATIQ